MLRSAAVAYAVRTETKAPPPPIKKYYYARRITVRKDAEKKEKIEVPHIALPGSIERLISVDFCLINTIC